MRILFAIHDFLPAHRAGSELYALALGKELVRLGHQAAVLCAEYAPGRPHGEVVRRELEGLPVYELNNLYRFASFEETYKSPLLGARMASVLDDARPDILHIHNLLNLSFELPALSQERGIPSVATLHDYTLVCPSGGQRVHLAEEHVCTRIDPERCSRCFGESPFHRQMAASQIAPGRTLGGLSSIAARAMRRFTPRLHGFVEELVRLAPVAGVKPAEIEARLRAVQEVFKHVSLFVAPSPSLAREMEKLGIPRWKLKVSDYGFAPFQTSKAPRPNGTDQRLRIGFVGTLAWHKGVHILMKSLKHLPKERFRVEVFGNLETFPSYSADLREMAHGLPVQFHGGFDNDTVGDVYAQMDVLVVPSLWPENSPLVIHEAFMCGVPVVGARMGGVVDLVKDGESGLLYDPTSPQALAAALERIINEPALRARLAAQLPPVKTIAQDAAEWIGAYEEALSVARHKRDVG